MREWYPNVFPWFGSLLKKAIHIKRPAEYPENSKIYWREGELSWFQKFLAVEHGYVYIILNLCLFE